MKIWQRIVRALSESRGVEDSIPGDSLRDIYMKGLERPGSPKQLFEIQKKVLWRLRHTGYAYAEAGVGEGKTLMGLLAATVCEAERPIYVTRGPLVEKTKDEMEVEKRNFDLKPIFVVSYEKIANPKNRKWLAEIQPDLIVFDEAHRLGSTTTATVNRVVEYLSRCDGCDILVMSGTLNGYGATRAWFPAFLGLGGSNTCPLPCSFDEAKTWDDYDLSDEFARVNAEFQALPITPPVLNPTAPLPVVCRALVQAAGGVVSQRRACNASVYVKISPIPVSPQRDEATKAAYEEIQKRLLEKQPETRLFAAYKAHEQAAYGYMTKWDKPMPSDVYRAVEEWDALWFSIVEEGACATEGEVASRIEEFGIEARHIYENKVLKLKGYDGKRIVKWFDSSYIESCAALIRKEVSSGAPPSLIFVASVPVAQALAQELSVPYHHNYLLDEEGRKVYESTPPLAVVSLASAIEGANLQMYHLMYVIGPPSNYNSWEQLIGRMHRNGQKEPEVNVVVLTAYQGEVDRVLRVRREAAKVARSSAGGSVPPLMAVADFI